MKHQHWVPGILNGREMKLIFEVIKCYDNCLTCTEESTNESNQFCVLCKPGYYFEENTKNCYKYPKVGYYLKKDLNVLAKCYDLCLTCDQSKEGDKSHCLSCKANYLLYPSTNCLSCKSNGIYADYDQIKCIDNIMTANPFSPAAGPIIPIVTATINGNSITRKINKQNHQYSLRRARPLKVAYLTKQVLTASLKPILGRGSITFSFDVGSLLIV